MAVGRASKFMEIAGRKVGIDHPPLVICELGINHGGSLKVAKKMVDKAALSGAEIIKHQTHIIEDEMSSEAKKIIPGNADISIYEIMKSCALSESEEIALKKYVQKKGMIFISTPFSKAAANRLEKMNVPAYKIGSGECNNYPLVEHIASFGKPIILSTGMNDIESIKKSVSIIERKKIPYALLHTTNIYPTPNNLVRLNCIQELQQNFPNAIVGLSDHTQSNHACFGAVALGSSILERHFTDSMRRKGPDISSSMDPKSLKELLDGVNILFHERGGNKGPVKEEKKTIAFAFASVVSIKNISKGEKLTVDNIWVKRPGSGDFCAEDFGSLIGREVSKDIKNNKQIKKTDLKPIKK